MPNSLSCWEDLNKLTYMKLLVQCLEHINFFSSIVIIISLSS